MFRRPWTARTLVVGSMAAVAALLTGGVARATATLPLHNAHRDATAATFGDRSCQQIPGGARLPGKDGWVFVLPKNNADFVNLTLRFRTPSGAVEVVNIPDRADAYPDGITTNGTSKAWVVLPTGWKLLTGSATASRATKAKHFNLTHTCVGTPVSGSPSPSVSTAPSISASASASASISASASSSPSLSASASSSTGSSPGPSGSASPNGSGSAETTRSSPVDSAPIASSSAARGGGGRGLPTTGAAMTGMVLIGVAATVGGTALLSVRRRREEIEPADG